MKFIKNISVIILTIIVVIVVGCKKETNVTGIGIDNHGYVDLGLPSGTLWATCNLGADNPEDFGDYYAWGEVMPKAVYYWNNYRYCTVVDSSVVMTKYCIADSLMVLEPVDDAARASWGNEWRMPTSEDWKELYLKTNCEWTTRNGVDGVLLTGLNGNSIFLPAAGYHIDDEFESIGLGIYWSSTRQTTFQESAWTFHFNYDYWHVCGTYERNRGHVIRAVRIDNSTI